jgi:hypothetical protein
MLILKASQPRSIPFPPNPTKLSTEKYQQHESCGFSKIVISEVEQYSKSPVVYRGEEAVDKFLECLEEEQKHSRET